MYEEHFGLIARPFGLTPDARFWVETEAHQRAMAYLGYGLAQGEGFIVITGDVGAGKTMLVERLLERIDGGRVNAVRLSLTLAGADDLLRTVAGALGAEPAGLGKAELLASIEQGLHAAARTGRRTLLIADEAQALATAALEELRMLSNLQSGGRALVQVLLLGRPEFRDRLSGSAALEQLRQRVIAAHHLQPMGADEVEGYVAHRLMVAGWAGRPDFADSSFPAMHEETGGVPRRLNRLADRVMLHCAVDGVDLVDAEVVATVADDQAAELLPTPARAAPGPGVADPQHLRPRPYLVPEPEPHPIRPDASVAVAEPSRATQDDRVAALEARLEAQEAALRRVLTLLVDWTETGTTDHGRAAA